MSYGLMIDEQSEDALTRELQYRETQRQAGVCDYCLRIPVTNSCKFPSRHFDTRVHYSPLRIILDACEQEWEVRRGDVFEVLLNGPVIERLIADLVNGARFEHTEYSMAGFTLTYLVNPVTRTEIKVQIGDQFEYKVRFPVMEETRVVWKSNARPSNS